MADARFQPFVTRGARATVTPYPAAAFVVLAAQEAILVPVRQGK